MTDNQQADFEAWLPKAYRQPQESYSVHNMEVAFVAGYKAGRAALQSQDREDAEWMKCESRRPWVTNSLKYHAQELRAAEKRSRRAFNKDYMGEPARYFADACGEAAAVFEARLSAIAHARRVEGDGNG